MRRYHVQKINEHNKKQNEEMEKIKNQNQPQSSNRPSGPNISPSTTYNF